MSTGSRKEPLGERRETMPTGLVAQHALAGDPVQLEDPARAGERLVSVVRVVAAPKRDQGSLFGRDLGDDVLEVRPRSKQAKPAARLLPRRIHVEQDRDNLRG